MKSKLLSLVLISTLVLTSAGMSFAANGGANKTETTDTTTVEQADTEEQADAEEVTDTEEQADTDEQADPSVKENNSEKTKAHYVEKKAWIAAKKLEIRANYTQEELDALEEAAANIEETDPAARVLSFDSVISDDAMFKMDTPPVIKGNRTLIPVRAITEGFGAELSYDEETKVVTITKADTVIKLTLGSTVALVNDEEVQMDTNANIVNSRTYVPLRFVMETFKLTVGWDEETETIDISDDTDDDDDSDDEDASDVDDDDDDDDEEETTTDAAIEL